MMERVQRVADRERALVRRAVEAFGPEVSRAVEEARGAFGYEPPEGPLEEAVGGANIHEYLSEQVLRVEASEAAVVRAILETAGPEAEELAREVAYGHGRSVGESLLAGGRINGSGLEDLALGLNLALLDGMPCDQATVLADEGPGRLVLRRSLGVHREAWEGAGANVALMAELLGRWSAGVLEVLNPEATFNRSVETDGVGWCEDELVL
jgi:hypothetical protein